MFVSAKVAPRDHLAVTAIGCQEDQAGPQADLGVLTVHPVRRVGLGAAAEAVYLDPGFERYGGQRRHPMVALLLLVGLHLRLWLVFVVMVMQ